MKVLYNNGPPVSGILKEANSEQKERKKRREVWAKLIKKISKPFVEKFYSPCSPNQLNILVHF